jgi:hypothetical protein
VRAAGKAAGETGAPTLTRRCTRDHRPVIAHNNWFGHLEGSRWNEIFDIRSASSRGASFEPGDEASAYSQPRRRNQAIIPAAVTTQTTQNTA